MSKEIVKLPIGDKGEFILVEIESVLVQDDRVQKVTRLGEEVKNSIEFTKQTIEDSIENIGKLGNTIVSKIRSINAPDEIDIQFGLKLTAGAGFIIANVSGETHLQIAMKWNKS